MAEENNSRAREIVDTAARLFAQSGFDGVFVRDICSALSVNCSIVSYYFGGKKGLYLEVLRHHFAAYGKALEEVAERNLEPKEALLALIDAMREMQTANPYYAALITRESGCPGPEFLQVVEEHESKYNDWLTDVIRNGQRQGVFKSALKVSALALTINLLINGSATARASGGTGGGLSENDYFDTIKTVLLDGILADPAGEIGGLSIGKQSAKPRNTFGR